MSKPTLVIAGPGAGKTHNMVNTIVDKLPSLSPAKYMVVITYTNSATLNIKNRLAKKVSIPENLFIGTIHSFLNKFIVIPCGSFGDESIGAEKRFLQCQSGDVFEEYKKKTGKTFNTPQGAAIVQAQIRARLKELGFITFDQTVDIGKKLMSAKKIAEVVSNRIQFLFVDEFQDTNNAIFSVVEAIRKTKKTEIYCVGDPEQYIRSFDSGLKSFSNIPILKSAGKTTYDLQINSDNWRCSKKIVDFLNFFNARTFGNITFKQICKTEIEGDPVQFINLSGEASSIIGSFNEKCEIAEIKPDDRCIIAKKNDVIRRIESALAGSVKSPKKVGPVSPIQVVKDTLLSVAELKQNEFCEKYKCNVMGLRKYCLKIISAIHKGEIIDQNSFHQYVTEELGIELKNNFPIKIKNLKSQIGGFNKRELITVCNIHTIKGLEEDAVLALAKTEAELLLWLNTDFTVRDANRTKETTDYPRIGYVAFSRAKKLLCIACLEPISSETLEILRGFGVEIDPQEDKRETGVISLF